jgi:probable rRNA maturation factor
MNGAANGDDAVGVVVSNEQDEVAVDTERWARLAADVLRHENQRGELTLTFVDQAEIVSLNAEYMSESGPTDVLSFPLDAAHGTSVGPRLLGDVVICPSVAAVQAPQHAGSITNELALLTVHGILHILGHDHAEPGEAALMRTQEAELLRRYHFMGDEPPEFRFEHDDN